MNEPPLEHKPKTQPATPQNSKSEEPAGGQQAQQAQSTAQPHQPAPAKPEAETNAMPHVHCTTSAPIPHVDGDEEDDVVDLDGQSNPSADAFSIPHTEAATKAKEEEKKKEPCDTSDLVDGIVDKRQLEEACKTFYSTPGSRGSDGPLTRVYNGLDKRKISNFSPNNLVTNVKGAMFELQVALQLMQLKRGVKQFNLKCLKPNKVNEHSNAQKFYEDDFFEYDVVTNDQSVIECKNVKSWPRAFDDASNKEVTKLKSQLSSGPITVKNCRSKNAIGDVTTYKYEVHAANAIPEIWKDFMRQQGVAHIQDGYCPPDCGTIL